MPMDEEVNIMDVGCGTGRYIHKLHELNEKAIFYGTDISESTIEKYTKKTCPYARLRASDFSQGSPFNNQDFDIILSITVLQYVNIFKVKLFIKSIINALKTDGILYITFPYGENIFDRLNLNYARYTPSYISDIFKLYGAKIVDSGYIDEKKKYEFGYYIVVKK